MTPNNDTFPDSARELPKADEIEAAALSQLTRIAQGDQQAMIAFYKAFESPVYAFAMRRVRDAAMAEDVVVDTLYEVWRKAGAFERRSRVLTWVLGIARHKLLDKLRARDDRTEDIEDYAETLASEEPGAYEQVASAQNARQLASCLETLPPEQAQCMHLVFVEGFSVAEVADVQKCAEGTVKTRIFHAKRKLRECLEKMLPSHDRI
jgi:RNA polymerase sigma-70 factor (ECF subfamily)